MLLQLLNENLFEVWIVLSAVVFLIVAIFLESHHTVASFFITLLVAMFGGALVIFVVGLLLVGIELKVVQYVLVAGVVYGVVAIVRNFYGSLK